jgi:hypothetical protein
MSSLLKNLCDVIEGITKPIKHSNPKDIEFNTIMTCILLCLCVMYVVTTYSESMIKVTDKYIITSYTQSTFMIVDNTTNTTYTLGDNYLLGFYDTFENWSKLQVGEYYRVYHYGMRNKIMGIFPVIYNIAKIKCA